MGNHMGGSPRGEGRVAEGATRPLSTALALLMVLTIVACGGFSRAASLSDRPTPPSPEESAAADALRERRIRQCMEEAGFRYIEHPLTPGFYQAHKMRGRSASLTVQENAEYALRYGYGWTEQLIAAHLQFGPDPNTDVYLSLDEVSQIRYGATMDECWGKVMEKEGYDGYRENLNEVLSRKLDELDVQILTHRKVMTLLPDWSDCMREQGYTYRTLSEPVEDIKQRINRVIRDEDDHGHHHGPDTHTHVGSDAGNQDHALDDAILRERVWRGAVERLRELQPEETAIAVADLECRERTGLITVLVQVREELEAEFDRDNASLLAEAYG